MATTAKPRKRRRERRDEVKAALRAAAIELLEHAPYAELSVDEIARTAGISRSAFYFYFPDKQALLVALTEEVSDALYREADRWWQSDSGEPEALIRQALAGVANVYCENSLLLRTVTEVSTYDADVRQFWRSVVERFVGQTAQHLRNEQAIGRARLCDPDRTAEALVWMTERWSYIYLTSGERTPQQLVDALVPVWVAALYPVGV